MNKKITLIKISIIALLLTIPVFNIATAVYRSKTNNPVFKTIFAEDDEHEEEEEREEEDEHEDRERDREETVVYEDQVVTQNDTLIPAPLPPAPVIRYITIVDAGYNVDTDKDGLVDALDPNPTIPEFMFYTDSDSDGIPDASDSHNGEDDFKYVEFEDKNINGILDIFENLP